MTLRVGLKAELGSLYAAYSKRTVSGRELHSFLQADTPYRLWFPRMCEYGFIEGMDYTPYIFVHPQNKQESTDHQLTIEMAKEISMLQRRKWGEYAGNGG